jgi:hypothetical protein
MEKSHLKLVAPTGNRIVAQRRRANADQTLIGERNKRINPPEPGLVPGSRFSMKETAGFQRGSLRAPDYAGVDEKRPAIGILPHGRGSTCGHR